MQAIGLQIASGASAHSSHSVNQVYPSASPGYQVRGPYSFDSGGSKNNQQRIGNYLVLGKLAEGG